MRSREGSADDRGVDERAGPQREHLGSDDPGGREPVREGDRDDHRAEARPQDRHEHDPEQQVRHGGDGVDHPHQQPVGPPACRARDGAHRGADDGRDHSGDQTDREGDPKRVHAAQQHVATELIGAERVCPLRGPVGHGQIDELLVEAGQGGHHEHRRHDDAEDRRRRDQPPPRPQRSPGGADRRSGGRAPPRRSVRIRPRFGPGDRQFSHPQPPSDRPTRRARRRAGCRPTPWRWSARSANPAARSPVPARSPPWPWRSPARRTPPPPAALR